MVTEALRGGVVFDFASFAWICAWIADCLLALWAVGYLEAGNA